MDKVPTGIAGLDLILGGGILRGHSVLIEGAPGAGKTTFGLQFIHEGIVRLGEPGLIITFEESPAQLYHDAANFGWDLPALEAQDLLRVVCTSPAVLRDQFQRAEGLLDEWAQQTGARRMFVDSLTHLGALDPDPGVQRAVTISLLNALKQRGMTVFATREVVTGEGDLSFEDYIVDAVVRVSGRTESGSMCAGRCLEVLKTRGQGSLPGQHSFAFGPHGIEVFPLQVVPDGAADCLGSTLVTTGVDGLDHLLGGGLPERASALISGAAGTGKTTLGLQFLAHGAQHGERGLLFLYQESAGQARRAAAAFGWDLGRLESEGSLCIEYVPFAGLNLSEHLWRVRHRLEEFRPRRVVFDPLSAMLHEFGDRPHAARERTDQLVRMVRAMGATALYTTEVPTGTGRVSAYGVEESLVDAVIVLSLSRDGARRRRGIEVLKARGLGHELGEHRMRITDRGVRVFFRRPGSTDR